LTSLFSRPFAPGIKRDKLKADRIVSEEFNMRSDLVKVLRKIDSMRIGGASETTKPGSADSTVLERIQNLLPENSGN